MVSRIVVDVVLVLGLIVGTLGVLCLAYGFLGKSEQPGLRGLFLVSGVSALFALVLVELALFAGNDTDVPKVLAGSVIYGAMFTGAFGRNTDTPERVGEYLAGVALGVVGIGLVAGIVGIAFQSATWMTVVRVGSVIVVAVLVISILRIIFIRLPEHPLRVIGVLLTSLGIASQVVALGLDMLRIKVT